MPQKLHTEKYCIGYTSIISNIFCSIDPKQFYLQIPAFANIKKSCQKLDEFFFIDFIYYVSGFKRDTYLDDQAYSFNCILLQHW